MGKNVLHNPVKVMRRAKTFMAKRGSYRETLECVHLNVYGGAWSTDSYCMYHERNVYEGESINAPIDMVEEIAKCGIRGNETAEFELFDDGRMIRATMSGGKVFEEEAHFGYPTYERLKQIMGNETKAVAYIDPTRLYPIIREHKKGKESVRLELRDHSLTLSGKNGESPSVTLEDCADGEDVTAYVNPTYLLRALKNIDRVDKLPILAIEFTNPTKPIHFRAGDVHEIVMPVRMYDAKSNSKKVAEKVEEKAGAEPAKKKPEQEKTSGNGKTTEKAGADVAAASVKTGTEDTEIVIEPNRKTKAKSKPEWEKVMERSERNKIADELYREAVNRAANHPDSRVESMGINYEMRNRVSGLRNEKRLVADSYVDYTSWYLDGEFLCCIEERYSKRKIHLCYPPLKPRKCKEDMVKALERDEKQKEAERVEEKLKVEEPKPEKTKAEPKPVEVKPEPEPEPKEAAVAAETSAITLESVAKMFKGDESVAVTQKRDGCCIWVSGKTKEHHDELVAIGARWSKKRKAWYIRPAA